MHDDDGSTIGLTGAYHQNPKTIDELKPVERHLLSCLMHEPELELDRVGAILQSETFRWAHHKIAYDAMTSIRSDGKPVTLVTMVESLIARGQKNAFGGDLYQWLAETHGLEPNGAYARRYATDLAKFYRLDRLRMVGEELVSTAMSYSMPPEELGEEVERQIAEVTRTSTASAKVVTMKPLLESTLRGIDEKATNSNVRGLSTGYRDLDESLGGLRAGQQIIIGARPGGGKTAIGLNIASNAIAAGHPVLFISAEMPAEQIAERLLSSRSGVSMSRIATGRIREEEAAKINDTIYHLGLIKEPLMVDDASDQTSARIRAVVKWAVRTKGVKLAVIDYLQLITPENPKENRVQQVGTIARRLKQLARDCSIPIIVLCQLNREVDSREGGRPRLSDLRESGEIEAHADIVLLLHTPPNQPEEHEVWDSDIIVAKHRNGATGTCRMQYRRPLVRFEERSYA